MRAVGSSSGTASGAGGARELGRLFTGGTCAQRLLAAAFVILLQAGRAATTRNTRNARACVCEVKQVKRRGAIRGRGVAVFLSLSLARSLARSLLTSLSSFTLFYCWRVLCWDSVFIKDIYIHFILFFTGFSVYHHAVAWPSDCGGSNKNRNCNLSEMQLCLDFFGSGCQWMTPALPERQKRQPFCLWGGLYQWKIK